MGSVISRRIHLFEFHDLAWFPALFRNLLTEYLVFAWHFGFYYKIVVPLLSKALRRTNSTEIVDLCSGSGGPLAAIQHDLRFSEGYDVSISLTDLFPNIDAMERVVTKTRGNGFKATYSKDPVDATKCNLKGFRTIFSAFHHFTPDLARKILQNAVDTKNPIAIFEATERSFYNLVFFPLIFGFLAPIISPIVTPFFSLTRIFWTNVIPVMMPVLFWDSLVSCLRTYSQAELHELVSSLNNCDSFTWEIGTVKGWLFLPNMLYCIGYPKDTKKET